MSSILHLVIYFVVGTFVEPVSNQKGVMRIVRQKIWRKEYHENSESETLVYFYNHDI